MNWYLAVLKKYVEFNGRARRKEYWMYTLFSLLFLIVATILDSIAGTNFAPLPYGIFYVVYGLGTFLPGLAAAVRRLHDTEKSGFWIFIALVPLVGPIWLLVLLCTNGTPGENKYGPDPKGQESYNNDALDSHLTN